MTETLELDKPVAPVLTQEHDSGMPEAVVADCAASREPWYMRERDGDPSALWADHGVDNITAEAYQYFGVTEPAMTIPTAAVSEIHSAPATESATVTPDVSATPVTDTWRATVMTQPGSVSAPEAPLFFAYSPDEMSSAQPGRVQRAQNALRRARVAAHDWLNGSNERQRRISLALGMTVLAGVVTAGLSAGEHNPAPARPAATAVQHPGHQAPTAAGDKNPAAQPPSVHPRKYS